MNLIPKKSWLRTWWIVAAFMALKLIVHFSTSTIYELHRDAFMYIDLGNHLAWGYNSVPPSIAVFANLSRFLMGDNTFAIRFFPAITGVLSLLLIGIMVREAGGGNRAQFFALLTFLLAPVFLRCNSLFQPVSFDQFYWLLLAFLLFRLIRTGRKYYWYLIGLAAGLAFLNKYAVVFYIAGILVGILATPLRKWLGTPHPWIAAGIALLIAFPNLLWQYRNNWPVVNHMEELARTQLVNVRIDIFLLDQVMMFLPVVFVWILGLVQVAFLREGRPYRAFAWIYLTVILLLILLRGKSYYTVGAYSVLFVFGGLFIEARLKGKLAWIRYAFILHALIATALAVPLSLPVLKPDAFIRFYRGTPMDHAQRWEDGQYYDLPQDYADMIGWRELAGIVGRTYDSLSPEERSRCVIFANNYGEAGSVNFYGTSYGLPPVISYNDSYLFWAPDSVKADCLIRIGDDENIGKLYEHVEIVGRINTPYSRQFGTPVYFCTGQKTDVNKFYQQNLKERRQKYRNPDRN